MHDTLPEPTGNLDWGDFVTDIMTGILPDQDDINTLKETIHQEIKEKLYSACLWFLQYKDSSKEYLIDQDVDLEFMRNLLDDPGLNQTSNAYQEHVLLQAFIGKELPNPKPAKEPAPYGHSPFEYIGGRIFLKVKIYPPYPLQKPHHEFNEFGLPEKEFYTTGDICQLLGLHPDTFRYRLRTGIYPEPKKRAGDKRRFTKDEVNKIIRITDDTWKK